MEARRLIEARLCMAPGVAVPIVKERCIWTDARRSRWASMAFPTLPMIEFLRL